MSAVDPVVDWARAEQVAIKVAGRSRAPEPDRARRDLAATGVPQPRVRHRRSSRAVRLRVRHTRTPPPAARDPRRQHGDDPGGHPRRLHPGRRPAPLGVGQWRIRRRSHSWVARGRVERGGRPRKGVVQPRTQPSCTSQVRLGLCKVACRRLRTRRAPERDRRLPGVGVKLPTVLLRAPTGARISTDRSRGPVPRVPGSLTAPNARDGRCPASPSRHRTRHARCPSTAPECPEPPRPGPPVHVVAALDDVGRLLGTGSSVTTAAWLSGTRLRFFRARDRVYCFFIRAMAWIRSADLDHHEVPERRRGPGGGRADLDRSRVEVERDRPIGACSDQDDHRVDWRLVEVGFTDG